MTEGNGKVLLAWLPHPMVGAAVVMQSFMDSVIEFITYDRQHRQISDSYIAQGTAYIADGRNGLVQRFLAESNAEYLMMMDWDITFKPEDIYALIVAKRDIICGTYVTYHGGEQNGNTLRPCWTQWLDGIEYVPAQGVAVDDGQGEPVPAEELIVECTSVGMGFTMIHRSVLEEMRDWYPGEKGDTWHWFGHDLIHNQRSGEDVTFCDRARKLGFGVWGHGGVLLGHTKARTFTAQDIIDPTLNTKETQASSRIDKKVLNVGGGSKNIPIPDIFNGWEHYLLDIEPGESVDIVADVRSMPNVNSDVFDAVYASHMLEHLTESDGKLALAEMRRVLKPGCELYIRVPDIGAVQKAFDDGADPEDIAYTSPVGPIHWQDIIEGHRASISEGKEHMRHHHMYDSNTLRDTLSTTGFEDVLVGVSAPLELGARARKV